MGTDGRRVAIVGLGPKGLYSLERLVASFGRPDHAPVGPLEVVCFEPHPTPGAGPNYDPTQPDYLLLNFPADRVDMWPRDPDRPSTAGTDFPTWWREHHPGVTLQRHPPRAAVGRYLAAGLEHLLDDCPAGMTVAIDPVAVHVVRRTHPGWDDLQWDVTDQGGSSLGHFDEVLLTVGHLDGGPDALARRWHGQATLVPRVFPVEQCLSPSRIPPGAVVAVRGFALTGIDAVLALTEGRGGRFVPQDHPWRLTYHRPPDDAAPATILPFSRTGEPLSAKPEQHPDLPAEAAAVVAGGCDRILAMPDPVHIDRNLVPVLQDVATKLLVLAGGPVDVAMQIRRRLLDMTGTDGVQQSRRGAGRPDPHHQMRDALDVATGLRDPGHEWGLGETWQRLYPAIVARCGHGGIDAGAWPAFRRLAVGMERLAFGAPVVNLAKMLALVDAGILDLDLVTGSLAEHPDHGTVLRSADRSIAVDVVVDAVLPPPGVAGLTSPPIESLLRAGHLRRVTGRRGVEVRADAAAVGVDGLARPTLAVLGRPTEDWIIGNDTLSRTLHPHPGTWADGVVDRLTTTTRRVTA